MNRLNSRWQIKQSGYSAFLLSILLGVSVVPALSVTADVNRYESGANIDELLRLDQELSTSISNPDKRRELEAALIHVLAADSTFEAKRFACTRLAVCGTDASVDALAELLKHDETAGIACFALGSISSGKAGNALREALGTTKGMARVQIISTLGNKAEPASVPLLVQLADEEDAPTAAAAIRALGAIDDPAAHAKLAALRCKKESSLKDTVAGALLHVAERFLKADRIDEAEEICEELLRNPSPDNVRRGAFCILLQCDRDGGSDRIAELLEQKPVDPLLAAVAISHIPELEGWFVSKRFSRILDDLQPEQQVLLIDALSCRNESSTRKAIRTQLGSEDSRVKQSAVLAIGRTETEDAVPVLVKAFSGKTSDEDATVLETALAGLSGGEKTDRAIATALGNAEDALVRKALLGALSRRGGHIAVEELVDAACGPDETTSKAALQALTRLAGIGGTSSLITVKEFLKEGHTPEQRLVALRTLAAWRGTDTWDDLADAYLTSQLEQERALALRGMIRILDGGNTAPNDALITRYKQMIGIAHSAADKKQILSVLAGANHPGALTLALPLCKEPELNKEAVATVTRIANAIKKNHPDAAEAALKEIN